MTLTAGLTLADILAIQTDISNLDLSVSGAVLIDMAGDDYTMTYDEAITAYKVILNVDPGKTLFIPASANAACPVLGLINTQFAANNLLVEYEDGGGSGLFFAGKSAPALFTGPVGGGVLNACTLCAAYAQTSAAGVENTSTAINDIANTQAGKLIRFTSTGGAQTWGLLLNSSGNYPESMIFTAHVPAGCDGVTITGDAGVFVNGVDGGNQAISAGQTFKFWRDGTTENWYTTA
jgi:hypothetical protein